MGIISTSVGNGGISVSINASGSNRMVIALMSQVRNPPVINTATFDGVAMTVTPYNVDGSNASSIAYILEADLPVSSGSYAISTGSGSSRVTLIYCEGMEQQAPSDTKVDTDVTGTTTREVDLALGAASSVCVFSCIGGDTPTGVITGVTAGNVDGAYRSGYTETQTDVGILSSAAPLTFAAAAFDIISASGPVITNVNTTNVVQVGDTPVVTGTSFLATGGTQSWGGVSVGFSSWADTSITSSAITRGDLAYDTNYDWIVTDNLAAASTAVSVQLAIETGFQFVTLSSPIITLVGGYRTSLCYGSVPDCVTGDQLRAPTTTDQGKTLTINVDGTFTIAAAGNTEQTFDFEIWDANAATNDKWSASTAAVVNGVIVSGGILSNVLRSPLKDVLRNVLK